MMKIIRKFLGIETKKTTSFSDFFRNTSPAEQGKVLKRVIRAANNDQKRLMEEAEKISTQSR